MPKRRIAVLLSVLLSACGTSSQPTDKGTKAAPASVVPDPGAVTRAGFEKAGLQWPLTVDHGTMGCTGNAAWFESGSTRYGLNGFASEANGYADIKPIWAEDKEMIRELKAAGAGGETVIRINIGDMIKEALKQCA
jgi:hypothetical protein